MSAITTVEDYRQALKGFDWYYDFSDDYSYWARARARLKEIEAAKDKFDPDRTIWDELVPKLSV